MAHESDKHGEGLIERLRAPNTAYGRIAQIRAFHNEAADWIEKLERENLELRHDLERATANHSADLSHVATMTKDDRSCVHPIGLTTCGYPEGARIHEGSGMAPPPAGQHKYRPDETQTDERVVVSSIAAPVVGATRYHGKLVKPTGWQDADFYDYVLADDYEALRQRFEKACGEVTRLSATLPMTEGERLLVLFGAWAMDEHRDEIADIDGGALQEQLVKLGMLESVDVAEACGDFCKCAEYGDGFPTECLRATATVREALSKARKVLLSPVVTSDGGGA